MFPRSSGNDFVHGPLRDSELRGEIDLLFTGGVSSPDLTNVVLRKLCLPVQGSLLGITANLLPRISRESEGGSPRRNYQSSPP